MVLSHGCFLIHHPQNSGEGGFHGQNTSLNTHLPLVRLPLR